MVEPPPPGTKGMLYDHLKVAILTMDLRPGADIDEAGLSDKFGLSRTPLREVIRRLAGEGYIDLHKGRGARVSEMSHTSLRDFFQAAPMIYGAILRLAAMYATPAQIAKLEEAQTIFRAALKNGAPTFRTMANNRFHEITGDMAANIYLLPSFTRLLIDHARIGMTFYEPRSDVMAEKLDVAADQHDAIIAAIKAHDADTAAQLAEDHWNLSRDQIEMFVMPAALDLPLGQTLQPTAAKALE